MKVITPQTKIATLIKENPDAIDAIAGINPHFRKLKNPVLRKVLASRVTIADAAKIGKCSIEDFFERLKPLGFIVEYGALQQKASAAQQEALRRPFDIELDVRADIENGMDPFKKIIARLSELPAGDVLLLVNSFEPVPLIRILEDKRYTTEVVVINDNEVHTYISRKGVVAAFDEMHQVDVDAFNRIADSYAGKMQTIDVRHLPMPQPMVAILGALQSLPAGVALFVHHKKIPRLLLPELEEKQYEVVFKPADDGFKLIIYKVQQV